MALIRMIFCYNDKNSYLVSHLNAGDTLEGFGIEEAFLPPEDFVRPGYYQDGSSRFMARAAEGFTPEADGTYSRERVIAEDIRSRDEIGELYRDIRNMQKDIVNNTQKLAIMSAEKERIRTELDMAAGIQAGALPWVFPAFPERGGRICRWCGAVR